jgi:hypothetical protein
MTIVLISSILLWKKIDRGKLEEKSNEIHIDFSLKGATDILLRMILLTHIIMMS